MKSSEGAPFASSEGPVQLPSSDPGSSSPDLVSPMGELGALLGAWRTGYRRLSASFASSGGPVRPSFGRSMRLHVGGDMWGGHHPDTVVPSVCGNPPLRAVLGDRFRPPGVQICHIREFRGGRTSAGLAASLRLPHLSPTPLGLGKVSTAGPGHHDHVALPAAGVASWPCRTTSRFLWAGVPGVAGKSHP